MVKDLIKGLFSVSFKCNEDIIKSEQKGGKKLFSNPFFINEHKPGYNGNNASSTLTRKMKINDEDYYNIFTTPEVRGEYDNLDNLTEVETFNDEDEHVLEYTTQHIQRKLWKSELNNFLSELKKSVRQK